MSEVCGTCGTYPDRHFPYGWRCSAIQDAVRPDTPACPKWRERPEHKPIPIEVKRAHLMKLDGIFDDVLRPKPPTQRDWLGVDFTARSPGWPDRTVLKRIATKRCVYFIDSGPYTKIGVTSAIRQRLSGLAGNNPFPMSLWGMIAGDGRLELQFHEAFAADRHRLEWFLLDLEAKARIRDWLLANGGEFYGEDKWMRPEHGT